ncbi:hypothetical protein F5Y05DRAFT_413012 [Hypoxylon sp. FL0543]|nr:hypothetical protein F5Y05DRAFT_413012 [Hypoxylon sp. FL0543]
MGFSKGFVGKLCLLSLWWSATIATPIETGENAKHIIKRAGNSPSDPIDAEFNTAGWENIAEEDCYVMLCLKNGNRVYQRVSTAHGGDHHRTESGQSLNPFHADQLASRHTAQINQRTTSPEEFPWASTTQGGADAVVLPATVDEQNRQSSGINAGYAKARVGYNQWFRITFTEPWGKYCTALFSQPPDFSVCDNNEQTTLFGTAGVILANFVYYVVRSQRPYFFRHAAGPKRNQRSLEIEAVEIRQAADERFYF